MYNNSDLITFICWVRVTQSHDITKRGGLDSYNWHNTTPFYWSAVPRQKNEHLRVSILPLSAIFLLEFRNVAIVRHFLFFIYLLPVNGYSPLLDQEKKRDLW